MLQGHGRFQDNPQFNPTSTPLNSAHASSLFCTFFVNGSIQASPTLSLTFQLPIDVRGFALDISSFHGKK